MAIKINEEYAKAYVKRGDIYMQLKSYEEAVRDFS